MDKIYDVIVVGAGPCGATAAYFLAKPEKDFPARSVALLDRATFPRDKYCGDAWCAPALDIMEEMNVLQKLEAQGLTQDCTSGGFVSPSGESFISTGEESEEEYSLDGAARCYAIKRFICDEAIARRAAEVGAELIENADVENAKLNDDGFWTVACRDGRTFRSRMLIAADGAASNLSRSLGIVNTAPDAAASRQYVKGGTHNFKSGGVLFYPEYAIPGYVAIFRHYNDDIDLGVYLLENGATKPEDILQVSEEILKDPFMQRMIGHEAVALERPRVATIRTGGVEKSFSTQFMAVGDAAGQTDPLTGEGIHTGMIGAKIAAQRIHELFQQNDFSEIACEEYHTRWWNSFGKDFPASAIGGKMTYKVPLFLDAANVVAQRKGDVFMADFGAAMTGVKPKTIFLKPSVALPMGAEVVRQWFIQKIKKPYRSMRHAYDMHAIENDTRPTAFQNAALKDPTVKAGLIKLDVNKQSPLEKLFQFESTDPNPRKVLVLYASEYGFAEESATKFCEELFKEGKQEGKQPLSVRCLNARFHEVIEWKEIDSLILFCSTCGDGDIPQSAKSFFEKLESKDTDLKHCDVSVLAMGDSAYPNYCAAGIEAHELLVQAGAKNILPLTKINAENAFDVKQWFDLATEKYSDKAYWKDKVVIENDSLLEKAPEYLAQFANEKPRPGIKNPFIASIKAQTLITKPEAGGKETFHVELDISNTEINTLELDWQAGDALGVLPLNPENEVNELLSLLPFNKDEQVSIDAETLSLQQALSEKRDIKNASSLLINFLKEQGVQLEENIKAELQDIVKAHESAFKNISAQTLVEKLPKLAPRYYSIASDSCVNKEQIDLCVASQVININGTERAGVASYYLNKALQHSQTVKVFVHPNQDFRLPNEKSEAACVMIGAGTGLAPYRAFMQKLAKQQSDRTHLLFFGCRHEHADYLYKEEMENWQALGLLEIHTAFSRDQQEKIYVQDRIKECAVAIWRRMESGDHFYICGDATQMAGDVENALLGIIESQGNLSAEQARDYLKAMEKERRYQKDVWV